jgi:hypothetical protein
MILIIFKRFLIIFFNFLIFFWKKEKKSNNILNRVVYKRKIKIS